MVTQIKVVSQDEPKPNKGFESAAFFDEDGNPVEFGGGGDATPTAWDDITDKPAVIAAGEDAAAARTAIGAGTSSVVVGTGATNAAAGNHVHAASVVTVAASAGIVGANVQAVLADLAARVVALETP